jgi:hypothetical protein
MTTWDLQHLVRWGYARSMARLLDEIVRLQKELPDLDHQEQLLLKMIANLLESHYGIEKPQHRLTRDEYCEMPGRWELINGMLYGGG